MAKCKGGICALKNNPKKAAKLPKGVPAGAVHLPGFPPNQFHMPQAAAQVLAQQQQATPSLPQQMNNLGQGVPQQYNPSNSLQQQLAPLQQYGQGQQIAGPLQGFGNLNALPQSSTGQIPIPQLNQQNAAIPQGQVLHRTGKQRGGIGKFFLGSRPEVFNSPNFTPFQSQVLNYLLQYGLGGLQDLDQNQFDFAPVANQQLENFYTQTIPSIAERFTSLGGGQRSSAFQGALGQAGRGLANDLASQQQQYNLQQQGMEQNLISNLLNMGLVPQFAQNLNPGKGGAIQGLVNAGAQLGKAAINGAMLA